MSNLSADNARAYDASFANLCAGPTSQIFKYLLPGQVLDVGCGSGKFTLAASTQGFQVSACDTEPEMTSLTASILDQRTPTHGVQICVDRLPELVAFPDNSFDNAVANFVIDHFTDPSSAVRGLSRVVRFSGRVLTTTWSEDFLAPRDLTKSLISQYAPQAPTKKAATAQGFPRTPEGVAQLHKTAGLRIVRSGIVSWNWETNWNDLVLGLTAGIGSTSKAFLTLSAHLQQAIKCQLQQQIQQYLGAEGVYRFPCKAVLCASTKPA